MANSHPPALAAMIPGASGTAIGSIPGNDTQGAVYRGGIPQIGLWAWWYHDMATTERLVLPPNTTQEQRIRIRNSRSEEHTSELQSLMRISYAVFCLKKKKTNTNMHIYKLQQY